MTTTSSPAPLVRTPPSPPDPERSPQTRRTLYALIPGGLIATLNATTVTVGLATLAGRLHATVGSIGWVSTAYLLALALTIPLSGWAQARWGGRASWIGALIIFGVGSILSGFAWNVESLIIFRVIQGIGAGLVFPLLQTLAVEAAGGRASSRLIATVSLPVAVGPALGPILGGVILHWLSWRWLFLINAPLTAAVLASSLRNLAPDSPARGTTRPRLDLIGLALLVLALGGILTGLSDAESGGFAQNSVMIPLCGGVAMLLAFAAWALRFTTRAPIVDIGLLRLRSLSSASAVLLAAGAAMYAGYYLLPLYYQRVHGDSVLNAGLLLIPQGVGSLIARFIVSRLVDRFGARAVTIGSFLVAAGATVPFALAGPNTSAWWLGAALFVRGVGIGAVLIPPLAVAYLDAPRDSVPDATMNTRIAQQVGASFGIALVAVALQSSVSHGLLGGLHVAFWWAVVISLVALLPALALRGETTTSGGSRRVTRRS